MGWVYFKKILDIRMDVSVVFVLTFAGTSLIVREYPSPDHEFLSKRSLDLRVVQCLQT